MALDKANYLATVSSSHRKALGQFFTHPKVAAFMVQWVLESGNASVHDPAFGMGAFLDATTPNADVAFTGSEVDPDILNHWKATNPEHPAKVYREDYLLSWGRKYENIVCNPPYLRFQKFLNRNLVFEQFEKELNLKLSGYINTASAFLIKSLAELEAPGRLAYIMPLEFLNTGYGTMVKERLIDGNHLVAIIRLDCEKDVFPDSITSVGLILYDLSRTFSDARFYVAHSIEHLGSILEGEPLAAIPYKDLSPAEKWLPYFDENAAVVDRTNSVPLKHYGRFSRGIATGANQFFVLKPSRASDLGLGDSEVTQVVTRSSQIKTPFFTEADYQNLIKQDEPALLFDIHGKTSEKAGNYICVGEQQGYNRRFLTKSRKPWYKTESRQPSPLLLGVFSRGGYKIIRNTSAALNLTCFHGFQPNLLGLRYIDHLFLYFFSKIGREILSLSIRKYGDSLDKFEPNDLNGALVPTPDIFDEIPGGDLEAALTHLNDNGEIPQYAESWFRSLKL